MKPVQHLFNKDQIIGNVFSTTNYDFFRGNRLNREVKSARLERIKDSLQKYGQIVPVICNKSGYVLDGHGRLAGCSELNIPVLYVIVDVTDEEAEELIQEINEIQKQWTIQDHIEYYAKKGNIHYLSAIRLGDKYGIRPGIVANSLGAKKFGTNQIKTGKLVLSDVKTVESFLKFHKTLYFMPNKKQAYFIQALFDTWSNPKTDEDRLFKIIARNKELFEFSIPRNAFIKRIKDEYNKGLRKESNKL